MDDSGNVTAWESEFFVPQSVPPPLVPLVAATLAGLPVEQPQPGNMRVNSAIPYKLANVKTVCHLLETTPLRPSWIRAPGGSKIHLPTNASCTSWRQRLAPIRLSSA
jgi:nicotinate dehydrogenase subunit B